MPSFQKGDKTDPANYRPISLTCILCKTMENIIASNLCKHFNQHNIVWCESTLFSWVDSPDQENGSVELLGSPERKWGVPGE